MPTLKSSLIVAFLYTAVTLVALTVLDISDPQNHVVFWVLGFSAWTMLASAAGNYLHQKFRKKTDP